MTPVRAGVEILGRGALRTLSEAEPAAVRYGGTGSEE